MVRPRLVPRRRRLQLTALIVIAALGAGIGPVTAAGGGTKTSQAAMLTPVGAGITVTPLITVGEAAGDDGYVFESVPDGIAVKVRNNGVADVYVNHETSRVPFPYTPSAPTEANSQNDFDNAQVSKLTLHRKSAGVLSGSMVITSDSNYQRFCSSYLATAAEGFDREILFTNEESVDWVNRTGNAWPAVIGADEARQSGVVVAYDIKSGEERPIWGMGRHNHENSVPIPGFDDIVMLSGDDTFTNNPSQSQLYSYIAPDADAVWNDEGDLWAFQTNGSRQRYEDFVPGDATSVSGQFIKVPRLIATGRNADGTDLMAGDVPESLGGPYPSRRTARHGSATRTASASMAHSGSSMSGRGETTSSASSVSRTSRTTSDRACPMSRTSWTPAGAPRLCSRSRPRHPFRNSDPGSRRTGESGRWSSIPTTRPR